MDKNAYAKGWWDAMAVKRAPDGFKYDSMPPAIPVSEISRILILVKKQVQRDGTMDYDAWAMFELIKDKLELRRRSRV